VTRERVEKALRKINPACGVFEYHDTIVAAPEASLHPLRRPRILLQKVRRTLLPPR
jgi:hypothetical protein